MPRIPDNIIEDILSKTDIVELISCFFPLKRAGRNFRAVCPFHAEKTPSFMVSADKQIYHCFGCGAGGNAIGFLMQYERISFLEAVESLAVRLNISLPKDNKNEDFSSINAKLYKINELAINFFQENLLKTKEGDKALEYLNKRNITLDTIRKFRIGYTGQAWDSLLNYLTNKKVPLKLIESAGLIITKEKGGYYDRFRNRLIIPIFDIKDRPIGFGARVLDNSLPKYINSPETPIYTKGEHLYGLPLAKNAIRTKDQVVIVEGYMDFLACFTSGFENIVASLGTALNENQIRLLKRFTNNVVMIFDPDSAGEIAGLRSLDLFIEEDILVKAVILTDGLDPDNFIKKFGLSVFQEKVDNALDIYDFKLSMMQKYYNSKKIDSKAKIASGMLSTIAKIKNEIIKSEYIKKLTYDLSVSEESLKAELSKLKNEPLNKFESGPVQGAAYQIDPKELLLIKLFLQDSDFILNKIDFLDPGYFKNKHTCEIFKKIYEYGKSGKTISVSSLLNAFDDEITNSLICSIASKDEQTIDKELIFHDCINRIKLEIKKNRTLELQEEIKVAERNNDTEKLEILISEFYSLTKKGEK